MIGVVVVVVVLNVVALRALVVAVGVGVGGSVGCGLPLRLLLLLLLRFKKILTATQNVCLLVSCLMSFVLFVGERRCILLHRAAFSSRI